MGKFVVSQEKVTYVNEVLKLENGKNTSAEVNIVSDSAIHLLNLQPLCAELDIKIEEIKFNIKGFIASVNELLRKNSKNLRLDIKIGMLVTKTLDSGEKELEF